MPQLQWQLLLWKPKISPQSVFFSFLLFRVFGISKWQERWMQKGKLHSMASYPWGKISFRSDRMHAVIDGAQLNLLSWRLSPNGTVWPTSEQAQCHASIWAWVHAAKWPCRRIKYVCWGQESQSETSKQLSIRRFTCLWLRGCDIANPDFG